MKMRQISNRDLLQAYQSLLKKKRLKRNKIIEEFLKKADIRTLSGIAVVTSLIKPYSCPGKCVYCPTEAKMPKSYLASEPAAARALGLKFDPYEQMQKRILMLESNGHPTDKIEYIIKGGTWNAYPLNYQYWFILESFRACNELSRNKNYKKINKKLNPKSSIDNLQKELEKQQKENENAKHRIIGLTLETRPDTITPKTIFHMRKLGCTRIELGLQAPDDKILKLVKRGHSVQQFKDAMLLLRQAGFKVDLHFMPDLPGTTPKKDVEMYKLLFSDPAFCPDMVKIYPNTVILSSELYDWYKQGKYKPYGEKNLFNALIEMKLATPRYCRISRLIRDIPNNEIYAGNSITNLREALNKQLEKIGKKCVCLRCREISRQLKNIKNDSEIKLFVDTYKTIGGDEYFLTLEDKKRTAVYAFLRLRIPTDKQETTQISPLVGGIKRGVKTAELFELMPEIKNTAFIRELHTYGQLVSIGKKEKKASQHKGMGKKLIKEAEKIAKKNGLNKIAVISGVGVRGYYKKFGYRKKGTYVVKNI
jgi:elongator complex protein 3